jgi:hypothetical protein
MSYILHNKKIRGGLKQLNFKNMSVRTKNVFLTIKSKIQKNLAISQY